MHTTGYTRITRSRLKIKAKSERWKKDTVRIDIRELDQTHKRKKPVRSGRKQMTNMGADDIQRIYDKLEHLSTQVTAMAATHRRLDKAVNDNGSPGLLTRTTILEQAILALTKAQAECPAREAIGGQARRQSWSNIIALGSLAVALLAVFVAIK